MRSAATAIRPEGEKLFTVAQELSLSRARYERRRSPEARDRLARLLLLDDAFAEMVALLEPCTDLSFVEEIMLAQALLAAETEADSAKAGARAERAAGLASSDEELAVALAVRGKAELRLEQTDRARATLVAALELDPANKDACKRLATLELSVGAIDAVLELTDRLLERGGGHARVFAAQALAQARAGDGVAARATMGAELRHSEMLAPPDGWDTIEGFNSALAEELLAHPGTRWERYGSASEATWRIEAPLRPDTPLFRALVGQIIAAAERVSERAAASEHPWARTRPPEAFLRTWCVITESDGFETWHVHQLGWLSGVYYVQVPDSITRGSDRAGCLAFGLPVDLAGADGSAEYGEELVRPRPGLFLAFPSHAFHRTYPHGTGERRICVAFDVRPL